MNVCIICSLKNEEQCMDAVNILETIGMNVWHPFMHQNGEPLYLTYSNYLKRIDMADLVLALPKTVSFHSCQTNSLELDFGESTTYEMAYANHAGKPVIFGLMPFIKLGGIHYEYRNDEEIRD